MKNNNKLFNIFVGISVICIVVIIGYTIYQFNQKDTFGFSNLAIGIPFVFIPPVMGIIWLIYFCIEKSTIVPIIVVAIIGTIVYFKNDITLPVKSINDIDGDYLIKDEKMYYVKTAYSEILSDILSNRLMSLDLKTHRNKRVCKIDQTEARVFFIKNNELYYSSGYDDNEQTEIKNRKIDLKTCNITKLIKDYKYIKNTETDNYVYMYKEGYNITNIIKYDYINNKILGQYKIDNPYFDSDEIIIDYDRFNIFNITNNQKFYKFNHNNKKIYESDKELKMLTYSNNYVLFYDKENIYKYDVSNSRIIETIKNPYKNINRFLSDTNDNYFEADNGLYKYENNKFEKIVDLKSNAYYSVLHYGNKLLLYGENTNDGALVIDLKSKELNEYNEVEYHTYDNNTLYIVTNDDEERIVKKIKSSKE